MAKKEKKDKKEKKERRDKKRKRELESSDSEEEDRGRRRLEKEAERLAQALKKGTTEAFANDEGELQLGGRFVWKKKIEKELQDGARTKDIYERERMNTDAERKAEIEKVQRRREDREQEREQREREQEQLSRDRAAAEATELERKEDEFHLENAKARARHRLQEGRQKPVDLLVRDLMLGEEFDVGSEPPYSVFNGLSFPEVQELEEDILEYQELDSTDEEHAAWWESLLTVCEAELKEAKKQDDLDRARLRGERALGAKRQREVGVHTAVDVEIQGLLSGQTYGELLRMEEDLQSQLDSGTAPDPEFHSAILRRMVLHKAKARLRDMHSNLLARSLAAGEQKLDVPTAMGWRDEYLHRPGGEQADAQRAPSPEPGPAEVAPSVPELRLEDEDANLGQWSPAPLEPEEYAGRDVEPEEDDLRTLNLLRTQVQQRTAASFRAATLPGPSGSLEPDRAYQEALASGSGNHPMNRYISDAAPQNGEASFRSGQEPEVDEATLRQFRASAANSMGDINEARDAPFGGEVNLESKVYWWHDKYRPRKPKYFNRVHTGYEWNKYNQTHYDHDNPPPKVVQGYKFNVFYPDLIDKKAAPEYTVEPDPEADQFGSTCILRFHAGPPYEDLTFRILNKEWEYSHKKGFKCVFDRDTLYLYFNFKRQRYRR